VCGERKVGRTTLGSHVGPYGVSPPPRPALSPPPFPPPPPGRFPMPPPPSPPLMRLLRTPSAPPWLNVGSSTSLLSRSMRASSSSEWCSHAVRLNSSSLPLAASPVHSCNLHFPPFRSRTHTHIHARTHTHTHAHTCSYMHTHAHTYLHTCTQAHTHACTQTH